MNSKNSLRYNERTLLRHCVLLAIFCALILLACYGYAPEMLNSYAQTTLTPAEYYQKVEQRQQDKQIRLFTSLYRNYLETCETVRMNGFGLDTSLALSMDPSITTPAGIQDIKDLKLTTRTSGNRSRQQTYASLSINNSRLADANLFTNLENGLVYLMIPELSPSYLYANLLSDDTAIEAPALSLILQNLFRTAEEPTMTSESFQNISTDYSNLLIESANHIVLQKKADVTAGQSSDIQSMLTVTYTKEELYSLAIRLLQLTQKEEEIRSQLAQSCLLTTEEFDASLRNATNQLERRADQLSQAEAKTTAATMSIWLDRRGTIVGRTLTLAYQGHTYQAGYHLVPASPGYAIEATLGRDHHSLARITGQITPSPQGLSGQIQMDYHNPSTDLDDAITLTFQDLMIVSQSKLSFLKGELEVSTKNLSTVVARIDLNAKKQSQQIKLDLVQGSISLASLQMELTPKPYQDFSFPDQAAAAYEVTTEFGEYLEHANKDQYNSLTEKFRNHSSLWSSLEDEYTALSD